MSKVIHKKTLSSLFGQLLDGSKTFDLRLADWDCQTGDTLVFDEVDDSTRIATGRSINKKAGFILKTKGLNFFTLEDVEKHGFQVISLLDEEREL